MDIPLSPDTCVGGDPSNPRDLTDRVLEAAFECGFDQCAVSLVDRLPAADRLYEWLRRGMHGSMSWMARVPERRADPRLVLENARSIVIVSLNYYTGTDAAEPPDRARISRYAWGSEYHAVVGARLEALAERLRAWAPGAATRWYVDTGPVLEKAWAEHAGIGWIGKHTNLITQELGSWVFLGALLTDLTLVPDPPHPGRCGTCTRCIDACPTDAIVAPYLLDARLCISYLTIENRGPIPPVLRSALGNHVFGCDDCQQVCPWNRFAQPTILLDEFAPRGDLRNAKLVDLIGLDEADFRDRFRDTPVLRARRSGFARNIAVAIGNSGDAAAIPALCHALEDPAPIVRAHAAWALGQIAGEEARRTLVACLDQEEDSEVRAEAEAALTASLEGPRPPTGESGAC